MSMTGVLRTFLFSMSCRVLAGSTANARERLASCSPIDFTAVFTGIYQELQPVGGSGDSQVYLMNSS